VLSGRVTDRRTDVIETTFDIAEPAARTELAGTAALVG
jgi:hypothetical protein